MKHILFFASLLFFVSTAVAREPNKSELHNVVELPNTPKDELYNRAKKWTAMYFVSAKNVIQLDDKENGKIIIKAYLPYSASAFNPGTGYSGGFAFTFSFDCKNDKYKYDVTGLSHEAYKPMYSVGNIMYAKKKKVVEAAQQSLFDLSVSFENAMKTPYSKSNW